MSQDDPRPLIVLISGPNLDRLGSRQTDVYGIRTLAEIEDRTRHLAAQLGFWFRAHQSAHEGALVEWIHRAEADGAVGILLNAGAYTHTSIAILDAILSVRVPTVEVHLSMPEAREAFRHKSVIASACVAKVCGFGADSYELALRGLVLRLQSRAAPIP